MIISDKNTGDVATCNDGEFAISNQQIPSETNKSQPSEAQAPYLVADSDPLPMESQPDNSRKDLRKLQHVLWMAVWRYPRTSLSQVVSGWTRYKKLIKGK